MNLYRIAMTLASPLSDRPDYGHGGASVPRGDVAYVKEQDGEYCVRSRKNPDWSGGCYKSEPAAEERLEDVEMFKHMNENR